MERVGNNCKKALNIEFEQDLPVGSLAVFGDGWKIKKIFF